jgi:hypothetical protein
MLSPSGHAGTCRRVAAAAKRSTPRIVQLHLVVDDHHILTERRAWSHKGAICAWCGGPAGYGSLRQPGEGRGSLTVTEAF